LILSIFIRIESSDITTDSDKEAKKEAESCKSIGYDNLFGKFTPTYSQHEGSGFAWYPYLKTGIENLLRAAESFKNLKKFKEAEELIKDINRYKCDLNYDDRTEVEEAIEKLKEKT